MRIVPRPPLPVDASFPRNTARRTAAPLKKFGFIGGDFAMAKAWDGFIHG